MAYGIPAETRPLSDDQRDLAERIRDNYVERSRRYMSEGGFE
jgi:hypothetical protein